MRKTNLFFRSAIALSFLGGSFLLQACNDDEVIPGIDYEEPELHCNPAGVSVDCFYPFPSNAFLHEEDGARVIDFGEAVPVVKRKLLMPDMENPIDGFAVHPPIFARMPEAVNPASLHFHTEDPSLTLNASSTTLVLDAESGELIPHFAEVPGNASATSPLVQIRLYSNLKPNHRYIVALQGLTNAQGETIEALESFKHLAFTENYPYFEEEQQHTRENILPVLEEAGVDLENLQLAWDFTTRSNDSARSDLLGMMDKTYEWLNALSDGPAFTIENIVERSSDGENADAHIHLTVEGTLEIPLFLQSAEPGARTFRNAQNEATQNGTTTIPVLILIPHMDDPGETQGVIQFGHGFFGSTDEMRSSFFPDFLHRHQLVGIGIDWWGLSSADMAPIVGSLSTNINAVFNFTERIEQSFVNQSVLTRAVKTSLPTDTDIGDYFQSDIHAFYGISLGHILGSTAVAVSREIDTSILSVGGGSFSFIMSRARPFEALMYFVSLSIPNAIEAQKFIALASIAMEKIDPMTYADTLLRASFGDTVVDRRVLAQIGIGDPAVPMLSGAMWGRSVGLPLGPSPIDIPIFPTAVLPNYDSALFAFDFQLEGEVPGTHSMFPPADNGVHQGVREDLRGQDQIIRFLRDGEIVDICEGPCSRPL